MKTNLHKHLLGVFKILKNRFDYINYSIGHSLTKGEENEAEIRKLLIDFLPLNYGIGSGIIIDTEGRESKQIDIIIFDKTIPNYTLSSESKIFLVDQVIATIEIKTTLTNGKDGSLIQALENVKSVKELKPSQLTWVEDSIKLEEGKKQSWGIVDYKPGPPICAVFFYTTNERKRAIDLDVFFNNMEKEIESYNLKLQPDLIFSLEHSAFFRHEDIAKSRKGKFHICLLNMSDNHKSQLTIPGLTEDFKAIIDYGGNFFKENLKISTKIIKNKDASMQYLAIEGDSLTLDPLVYKSVKIKEQIYFVDSYRGFLNFIFQIEYLLRIKKVNKNNFIEDYFPVGFMGLTDYDNGLKFEN